MTAYINTIDRTYPWFEQDIRNVHPEITQDQTGTTFPTVDDFAPVAWVDQPVITPPFQHSYEGRPEQVDSGWRMTWIIGTWTQDELDEQAKIAALAAMTPKQLFDTQRAEIVRTKGQAPDVL
jgi:hypothetical protein